MWKNFEHIQNITQQLFGVSAQTTILLLQFIITKDR
jgi:hypothetical protein